VRLRGREWIMRKSRRESFRTKTSIKHKWICSNKERVELIPFLSLNMTEEAREYSETLMVVAHSLKQLTIAGLLCLTTVFILMIKLMLGALFSSHRAEQ
jgi:hypothetical protein